ncbi:hypothetical protein KAR91_34590 [Candidatus Pacearchaeota archaeon]|nr:hypothetical protein [Candidatus Pacearchaeota archaeon]
MTGGQMQILLAEINKVSKKIDALEKLIGERVETTEDITDPTDNLNTKGESEPIELTEIVDESSSQGLEIENEYADRTGEYDKSFKRYIQSKETGGKDEV